MDLPSFSQLARARLPIGTVLQNPGGGTSTILVCDETRVCYRRGKSRFCVPMQELRDAYAKFAGSPVTTSDLKRYRPEVFDSEGGGHNCHGTVLFLMLVAMGLAPEIVGHGKPKDPFGVTPIASAARLNT